MKNIIIIIFLILFSKSTWGQTDKDTCEKFSIKVEIWNFMSSDYFTVTDSAVWVRFGDEHQYSYFEKELTCRITERIRSFLRKTNLDSCKSTYVNRSIDDAPNFDFTINYGGKVIIKKIYLERYNEYIELAKLMDNLVPKYFHLGYDDDYLKGKPKLIE